MKKSQRTRLAVLAAKEAASRSAEEVAEFTYLSTLATLHPDASKDSDDVSAAAATSAAPAITAAAAPVVAAGAPAAAPSPTLGSILKGALATLGDKSKLGADLAQARTDLAARTSERDTACTQLAAASAQLTAFASFFGLTVADLAAKDGAAVTVLLQQKVSALTTEQVAQLGFAAAQLPTAPKGDGDEKNKTLAEWRSLDAHARAEFFRQGGKLTD